MRSHASLTKDTEANEAASEAIRGAARGSIRWGIPLTALFAAGYYVSPIYRGLTIQFKVFLLMSGMVVGGAIEGDRSLRAYEKLKREARIRSRLEKDQEVWRKWEEEIEESQQGKRESKGEGS